jgi:hypothetical protein
LVVEFSVDPLGISSFGLIRGKRLGNSSAKLEESAIEPDYLSAYRPANLTF